MLEQRVVQKLTLQRMETEERALGGEYLPLSVYAARGFNVTDIEAKCKDHTNHDLLGKTYRVSILSAYSKT